MSKAVESFMADVVAKNPAEPQFHQAVREVIESVMPIVESTPAYRQAKILERMVEPEQDYQPGTTGRDIWLRGCVLR